jgi:hypothetical protein
MVKIEPGSEPPPQPTPPSRPSEVNPPSTGANGDVKPKKEVKDDERPAVEWWRKFLAAETTAASTYEEEEEEAGCEDHECEEDACVQWFWT